MEVREGGGCGERGAESGEEGAHRHRRRRLTAPVPVPVSANQCGMCRKKVDLTGFKCKCGLTFCWTHRYPEQHQCEFDYKAVGRDVLARANLVIKADKLRKI